MAGTPMEIPLVPTPQTFRVELVGIFYVFNIRWCAPQGAWVLTIADTNDVPLIGGIPLITGANLLEQYDYVGIAGQLIVQSDNDANAVPTYDNLGSIGHLFFIPDE